MTTQTDPLPALPRATVQVEEALDVRIVVPATRRLVAGALGIGALCDLALRSGAASAGGVLLVTGTAAAMLASGRLRTLDARALVATAPLFGLWLAVRTSDWLLPLDVVAAFGLLALGASLSGGGSLFDLSLPAAAQRAAVTMLHALSVPAFVRPVLARRAPRAEGPHPLLPMLRGAALAIPVVLVLGALLASADAVFASFFHVNVDSASLALHVGLVVLGAWTMLALLRTASAGPIGPRGSFGPRLGRTEITVVLGSLVGLFGAFSAAQGVALSNGGRQVLDTTGLTYAEYARSGFFQLLWVAALTIVVLLSLRAATAGDPATQRRFVRLGEAVVALTLVVVVVAIRRLALYQDAFGLTMLRLYSTLFALWVGAVVLGLGAVIAGVRRDRAWLPGAAAVAGLVLLLGLNAANPEALVVAHNLDRLSQDQEVDGAYLVEGLSLDAVPTIVRRLPSLDPATRAELLAQLPCPTGANGWAAYNASRTAALHALADRCGPS